MDPLVVTIIAIIGAMALGVIVLAVREDKRLKQAEAIKKRIEKAIDRDGDGIILEGTPLEQKAPAKKKAPAAKKKPVAKAKPVAKKKSSAAPKAKKKAVAKKKSK